MVRWVCACVSVCFKQEFLVDWRGRCGQVTDVEGLLICNSITGLCCDDIYIYCICRVVVIPAAW